MVEAIMATYVQEDADWTITVAGLGKEFTARAPGIIAARDRADQLVDKLSPDQGGRTVVHLLNGSALDFTAAYMRARLARPAPPASGGERAATDGERAKQPVKARKPAATKPNRTRTPAKRTTKTRAANGKPTQVAATKDDTPADVGAPLNSAEVQS